MGNKKRKTENSDPWDHWEQDTYQTGTTRPPKSHGGLIAFLLVLVIFLCGISTGLGLMNIRLFRKLNESSEKSPVAFSQPAEEAEGDVFYPLGFSGQNIPELWRLYQDIPQGIYITEVHETSDARSKGICPGDILLCVDGVTVTDTTALNQLLDARQSQPTAQVVVYRSGQQLHLTLQLMQDP